MGVKGDMSASLGTLLQRSPKLTAREIVKHVIATADDANFAQAYSEDTDHERANNETAMRDYWRVIEFLKELA